MQLQHYFDSRVVNHHWDLEDLKRIADSDLIFGRW